MALPQASTGTSLGFHVYPAAGSEGTLGNAETVIWSSIHTLCSRATVEWVAQHKHGISKKRERSALAGNVKLYIQQASEFYHAAAEAKPNTAPLIYYYAFLNLAKALCEIKKPGLHGRDECYSHGISWRPNPRKVVDFKRELITISGRGMWHALWESLMYAPCPAVNRTRVRISELFSFCPEISSEFSRATGSQRNPGFIDLEKPDVLYDKDRRATWVTFSLLRWQLNDRGISAPHLLAQMTTSRSGYLEVRSTIKDLRKFESAVPKILGQGEVPSLALEKDIIGINALAMLGRDGNLHYFVPVQRQLPFPLPQLVVNYTILFWLGSLVRYDPHSVRWLMDSMHWVVIDGFMSQSRLWLLELFEWAFFRVETTLYAAR